MSIPTHDPRGSLWNRWDLHFHTPSSYDYKGGDKVTNKNIVDRLVSEGVRVVAITDHHTIDVARIRELQKLGADKLTVLPGIELRSDHGGDPIHYICIFAEHCDLDHVWTTLQGKWGLTAQGITDKGGNDKVYVPIGDAGPVVQELGGVISIHAGAKSNSIESIKNREQFQQRIKYDITKNWVDLLEIGQVKDIDVHLNMIFPATGSTMAEERNASNSVTKRFFALGEQISGASYFNTRDHLGSIREMTNSTGAIQARYDYDPYGRTTLVSGTNLSDFQYAGYYAHQPSGLNLTKYRAYDPNTARWLSRDPLGEGIGPNLYAYCSNSAINLIDPTGLFNWSSGLQGVGYLALGVAGEIATATAEAGTLGAATPVAIATATLSAGGIVKGMTDLAAAFTDQDPLDPPVTPPEVVAAVIDGKANGPLQTDTEMAESALSLGLDFGALATPKGGLDDSLNSIADYMGLIQSILDKLSEPPEKGNGCGQK